MSQPIEQGHSNGPAEICLPNQAPKIHSAFNKGLLDYQDALDRCLSEVETCLPTEVLALEQSLGRVLRRDQICTVFVPPWPRAMMDGYAVKQSDLRGASSQHPVTLQQIDEVPAGRISSKKIQSGQTIRIMTGACVPEGADAVIRLEDTRKIDDRVIFCEMTGDNPYILEKGRDLVPGDITAGSGSVVSPALMGVMAAGGNSHVMVCRKPAVAIIPTGSELVPPRQACAPGQVYDINSHALFGLCMEAGAAPIYAGIVKDRAADLLDTLNQYLDKDLILLSGGISKGDYDIVYETLVRAGVKEIFWRVKVQPGKPLFVGKRGKTLVFGLPGNPVSSFVNFHLFVRPVIAKMLGKAEWRNKTIAARLANDMILKPGRRKFLRGRIRQNNDRIEIEIIPEQRSGIFSPMLKADVLVEIPGNIKLLRSGDRVTAHLLNKRWG
jgi:molybdopterin molybdotransferase